MRSKMKQVAKCTPSVCRNATANAEKDGKMKEVEECTPSVCGNAAANAGIDDNLKEVEECTPTVCGNAAANAGIDDKMKEVEECTSTVYGNAAVNAENDDVGEERRTKDGDDKMKEVDEGTPSVCGNGDVNDEKGDDGFGGLRGSCRREETRKSKKPVFDENGIKIDSNMCHQCQRNDKGRVVRCTTCKAKRFCIPCIQNWYPKMTDEQIAQACPFCLGNCNCRTCLRMEGGVQNRVWDNFHISYEEKFNHNRYLLSTILPFLKHFNQEQMMEKEIEAKIQGK